MSTYSAPVWAKDPPMPDEEVVERVCAGETALFEIIIRRYNRRLYRMARALLRDPWEAEEVRENAYVQAYLHLDQFAGRARFSTWLTKIAVYEAWAHIRRLRRFVATDDLSASDEARIQVTTPAVRDPEQAALAQERHRTLEAAIAALPEIYRRVFTLRAIEGLSVAETAGCLGVTPETVKIRLHRARRWLSHTLRRYAHRSPTRVFKLSQKFHRSSLISEPS